MVACGCCRHSRRLPNSGRFYGCYDSCFLFVGGRGVAAAAAVAAAVAVVVLLVVAAAAIVFLGGLTSSFVAVQKAAAAGSPFVSDGVRQRLAPRWRELHFDNRCSSASMSNFCSHLSIFPGGKGWPVAIWRPPWTNGATRLPARD